jgi:hypothetical protein
MPGCSPAYVCGITPLYVVVRSPVRPWCTRRVPNQGAGCCGLMCTSECSAKGAGVAQPGAAGRHRLPGACTGAGEHPEHYGSRASVSMTVFTASVRLPRHRSLHPSIGWWRPYIVFIVHQGAKLFFAPRVPERTTLDACEKQLGAVLGRCCSIKFCLEDWASQLKHNVLPAAPSGLRPLIVLDLPA